jgi:hypothetical protein
VSEPTTTPVVTIVKPEPKTDPAIPVVEMPDLQPKKRIIGLIKKERGRPKGHGNDWTRAVLMYYARFKKFPSGISDQMVKYYLKHKDLPLARAAVRAQKRGETFDYDEEKRKRRK